MATLAPSSTSNTSLGPQNSNNNSSSSFRDVSFSSYLNKNEETYMQKLSESSRSLMGLSIVDPPQEENQQSSIDSRMKKETAETEIGIFRAERYFNGGIDSNNGTRTVSTTVPEVYRYVKDERVGGNLGVSTKSVGTPSIRSESSWNSQKALLQNARRNSNYESASRKMEMMTRRKSFLSKFRCKCSCSDENSVDVDGSCSSTKKSTNSGVLFQENASRMPKATTKINGFGVENSVEFPAISSDRETLNLNPKAELLEKLEVPGRKSLEVFGSPILDMRNESLSMEKKLKVLPWGSNPRIRDNVLTKNYEDSGSDASSDLFEIESVTGKAKSFLARQDSDLGSPTGYAPSEASIAWTVVTASAADFPAMSEYATSPVRNNGTTKNQKPANREKDKRKSRSSLLLGCKSQKAVRASGDFQKRTTNQNINNVPRFKSETKPVRIEARNRISGGSISHPPQHLLYIP